MTSKLCITTKLTEQYNRDLSLSFKSGLVKFHEASLEKIIAKEKIAFRDNMKNIVLIDFDDTLVNSNNQFIDASYKAVCKFLNENLDMNDFLSKLRPTFPDFLANFGITKENEMIELIKIFQEESENSLKLVHTPEGMLSVLSCLYHEGVEVIVWKARDKQTATAIIKNLSLGPFINAVVGFDTSGINKPMASSEIIDFIENKNVIILGDSYVDQNAAKKMDAKFLQAQWFQKESLAIKKSSICHSPMDFLNKALAHFRNV